MTYYKWWNRKYKEIVEESKRIQLSQLNEAIVLMDKKGHKKTEPIPMSWSYGDTPSGSISLVIDMEKEAINLQYGIKDKAFNYNVDLAKVPTFNGGFKYFMICPNQNCRSHIRTLYKAPSKEYFLCRKCSGLIYRSQKEHNKTMDRYKRLYGGLFSAEEAYLIGMTNKLTGRLKKYS